MPTLSFFYGIIISMYWNDHLPPHFHAEYQDNEAIFDLEGNLIKGDMPARQQKLIAAWATIHHDELVGNWKLASGRQPVYKIEPLR